MTPTIALIGDFSESVTAHRAIPHAIEFANQQAGTSVSFKWIQTEAVHTTDLSTFQAIWCVPASPYRSTEGALHAIRFARENKLPFLGTCGGYQHAVLEFAHNVLQLPLAENQEITPDTPFPLIASLTCALVETSDTIQLHPESNLAQIYGQTEIEEGYRCSYGVKPYYLPLFTDSPLSFVGFDQQNEPRAFELADHPFFIGTAFQPERSALKNQPHPLITAFLQATSV